MRKYVKVISTLPVHVLVFPIYPILHLYITNSGQVIYSSLFAPLVISVIVAQALIGLCWIGFRDLLKSALLTSLLAIFFYSHGHVHALLYAAASADFVVLSSILDFTLSLLWILIAFSVYRRLRTSSKESTVAATKVMNLVSGVLLVFLLFSVLSERNEGPFAPPQDFQTRIEQNSVADSVLESAKPDIYFIVLDGYARSDVLQGHYGFSNDAFQALLEKRGFLVVRDSYANYAWTHLSLASCLNMTHLAEQFADCSTANCGLIRASQMIKKNEVVRFLKARGYTYVHFGSTWFATFRNPYADIEVRGEDNLFSREFYRLIATSSLLRIFSTRLGVDLASYHISNLNELRRMAQMQGPKFVFAHFIPPHHPYLFDREGRIVKQTTVLSQFGSEERLWRDKPAYLEQLMFMNTRIESVVGEIIESSKTPPIIILCSDHGPFVYDTTPEVAQLARLSNFLAVFLPEGKAVFPERTTLVNLFSRIFNFYFGAAVPLAAEKLFFSEYEENHFIEVMSVE